MKTQLKEVEWGLYSGSAYGGWSSISHRCFFLLVVISLYFVSDTDICDKVVDLSEIEGNTYDSTTTGNMDDYQISCGAYGEEQIFRLPLQPGATIYIRQETNDYDSIHELRAGFECPGEVIVACVDDPVCFLFLFFLFF